MRPSGSVEVTIVPVMMSGPLKPGPKCSDVRSYAWRASLECGCIPAFGRASRRLAAGIARMPRPTTTATVVMIGCRVTPPTQLSGEARASAPRRSRRGRRLRGRRRSAASARRDLRRRGRRFHPTTRPLAKPRKAGVSVSATSTAIATATEAAMPMVVRNGMLANERPISAISTVTPAKTTAEPAVPVARAADSSGATPARTWS